MTVYLRREEQDVTKHATSKSTHSLGVEGNVLNQLGIIQTVDIVGA